MSLPDAEVLELLARSFIVGAANIQRADHVGMSHGYRADQTAVGTTNGAGGRNVQLVVLAADTTVLHVLPGFWHPADLVHELRFAMQLHRLWGDEALHPTQKVRLYAAMHRVHVRELPAATLARSSWQPFDEHEELARYHKQSRDAVELDGDGVPRVKPLCRLVHDRMLARPFRRLADFDMEAFVDYGRPYYDNNAWLDKGAPFTAAVRKNRERERARARADAVLDDK